MMAPFFWFLRRMKKLRCSDEIELAGLDKSKHGGNAYNWHDQDHSRDTSVCDPATGGVNRRAVTGSTAHQVVTVGDNAKENAVVPFEEY